MLKTVHTKPIDTPETTLVGGAIVTCLLHLGGFITLDPIDYGVAIGAVLTPIVMFCIRLALAGSERIEDVVTGGDDE